MKYRDSGYNRLLAGDFYYWSLDENMHFRENSNEEAVV